MEDVITAPQSTVEEFTLEALESQHEEEETSDPVRRTFTEEEMFVARVGVAIRIIRLTKRMTQQKLASKSGVTVSTLSRIEQGNSASNIITIRSIERGLAVKPGWIVRIAS